MEHTKRHMPAGSPRLEFLVQPESESVINYIIKTTPKLVFLFFILYLWAQTKNDCIMEKKN